MIAQAQSEYDAAREKSDEIAAEIADTESRIDALSGQEDYDYYKSIFDEYEEGRAYVEGLLSGD